MGPVLIAVAVWARQDSSAVGLERRRRWWRREGERRRVGGRVGWRKGRRQGGAEAARGEAEVEAEAAVPTTRSARHLGHLLRRRSFAFSMSSYPKWVSVLGTLLEAVSGNPMNCAQPKMHMGSVIGDSLNEPILFTRPCRAGAIMHRYMR